MSSNNLPAQSAPFLTVRRFAEQDPNFSANALRWLIFNGASNGLQDSGAIVRIGRRVLIDRERFYTWVAQGRQGGKATRRHAY